jgi:valyl-tRNA synthetase
LKEYGADALRLLLLSYPRGEETFIPELSDISNYSLLLQRMWNAARYVHHEILSVDEQLLGIDLNSLEKMIQKEINTYDVFDYRFLDTLKDAYEDFSSGLDLESLPRFIKKIVSFIEHGFCGWYLELYKLRKKESSHLVLLYGLVLLLKFSHPVIPLLTEKIWQQFGF